MSGGGSVVAQDTSATATSNNRWQISTTIGHNFESQYYQVGLHYRYARWLDIGAHLGFHPLRSTVARRAPQNFGITSTLLTRLTDNHFLIGLQPRGNFRLGQGDLGFSLAAGATLLTQQTDVISPDLNTTVSVFGNPAIFPYVQLELSYTYWATDALGLKLGLASTYFELGELPTPEINRVVNGSAVNEAYFRGSYRRQAATKDFVSLNAGLTIRPF